MTTNEACRAEFEKWAASNDFYMDIRRDGQYASTATSGAWLGYQAALASRPVETNPVASKIDPIHGEKREVIINALCASSNWMRGYAEAFVDDFVDGKAEYVAVSELEGLADEWENMKVPHSSSSYELGNFDGYRDATSDLRNLINQPGAKP